MRTTVGRVIGQGAVAVLAFFLLTGGANAQSAVMKGTVQWSLVPSIQKYTVDMDIDGARFGFFGMNNLMSGFDLEFLNWNRDNFAGCGIGLIGNVSRSDVTGFQMGCFNTVRKELVGCHLGFYNTADTVVYGAQAGFLNMCDGTVNGGQLGIANYSVNMKGVQIGILNFADYLKGVQIGIFNMVFSRDRGAAVPVINVSF
ncbi:MAG: hypothetical protein C0404_03065 [Verrucomicrobia bacterium]|nr:hypothetical protein [Verrucomicrobiota bacterium]